MLQDNAGQTTAGQPPSNVRRCLVRDVKTTGRVVPGAVVRHEQMRGVND